MFFASLERGEIINMDHVVMVNIDVPSMSIIVSFTTQCVPDLIKIPCADIKHLSRVFEEIKNVLPEVYEAPLPENVQ